MVCSGSVTRTVCVHDIRSESVHVLYMCSSLTFMYCTCSAHVLCTCAVHVQCIAQVYVLYVLYSVKFCSLNTLHCDLASL